MSCTVFDVSGLTEVKMKKMRGWQGSYFVDGNGLCIAKSCSMCREVLDASSFYTDPRAKYGLQTRCCTCTSKSAKERADRLKSRSVSEIIRDRERIRPDGKKKCYGCKMYHPLASFNACLSKLDGLQDKCTVCCDYTITSPEQRKNKNQTRNLWRKSLSMRSDKEIELDRTSINPSGDKKCRKCQLNKPFSDFYVKRAERDGLRDRCKPCDHKSISDFRKRPYLIYWNEKGIPLECYVCGDPWDDADHVIAESCGGSDEPFNRLPMCEPCNSSKYSHPLEKWLRKKYPDIADEVLYRVGIVYGVVY